MNRRNLWAPWRIDYLKGLDQAEAGPDQPGCFLCEAAEPELPPEQADERLLLTGDEHAVLLLNRYPYTNGHLLIAPRRHLPELTDLSPQEQASLMTLATLGHQLLKTVMNPQGANLGMNIGRCAGAGLPGHVHMHLVPRWGGDTNFMDVVAGVRVIPQALKQTHAWLKGALAEYTQT